MSGDEKKYNFVSEEKFYESLFKTVERIHKDIQELSNMISNVEKTTHGHNKDIDYLKERIGQLTYNLADLERDIKEYRNVRKDQDIDFEVLRAKIGWIIGIIGFVALAFWDEIADLLSKLR